MYFFKTINELCTELQIFMFLLNLTLWSILWLWTSCSGATEKAVIGSYLEEHKIF